MKSGFVAIVGSPNVGKSTLMNNLIGQKVAIVTQKAHTTRNKVCGVLTTPGYQIVFLDTPGIHTPKTKLGQYMVKTAYDAARDVDLTIFIVDAQMGIMTRDAGIIAQFRNTEFLVAINKIDLVSQAKLEKLKARLEQLGVENMLCICAKTGEGKAELLENILGYLPEGPQYFPEDMVTDRPERFIAAELIREKLLENLNEEVPHGIGIEIEKIEEGQTLTKVYATIYCERNSHKGIVIGNRGAMLKKVGSAARVDLQMLFGCKVFLQLWVKVKDDWRNSGYMLKNLGYKQE